MWGGAEARLLVVFNSNPEGNSMRIIHAACYAALTFTIAVNGVLLYYAIFVDGIK
jgi:hypothetical protein